MLKKENRLVGSVVFGKSFFFSSPLFILKEKRNGLENNRFGIVVSKKVDKRAVVRNKIKRILRSSIVVLNRNMTAGHDMLVITRKEILNKKQDEVSKELKRAFEKSGFINK